MDERGVPVWFKRTGTTQRVINAQLLSTGEIAVAPITGLGFGIDPLVGHRIYDLDGTLSAERFTDGSGRVPDRPSRLRRGSRRSGYGVLSYPLVTGVDLQQGAGSPDTLTLATACRTRGRLCTERRQRLERDRRQRDPARSTRAATLVWRWTMSDHFDYRESTFAQCFGNYSEANGGVDLDPARRATASTRSTSSTSTRCSASTTAPATTSRRRDTSTRCSASTDRRPVRASSGSSAGPGRAEQGWGAAPDDRRRSARRPAADARRAHRR